MKCVPRANFLYRQPNKKIDQMVYSRSRYVSISVAFNTFFEFEYFCIIYRAMVYVNQRHLYFNAEDLVEKLVDIFTMLRS